MYNHLLHRRTESPLLIFCRSYSTRLDPPLVCVLAKTALHHQVPALKETIYKHITRQPSLRVRISVNIPDPGSISLTGLARVPKMITNILLYSKKIFPALNWSSICRSSS
jgi:hypothetical protein